ncbi:MAG: IPExxxVDY family protein [Bacteroidota bacterium]
MAGEKFKFSSDEYLNFKLIGMRSDEKGFRLAWLLNKTLLWDLELSHEVEVTQKNNVSKHDVYAIKGEENELQLHLIANRSLQGMLLPEYHQMDYFLKIEHSSEGYISELISELRKLEEVTGAFEIQTEGLKNIERFIFD